MAFTGDLEYLHIVDIIQLVNTTRKSGVFSVTGERGESRIIFSNGAIVAASHLNGRVRIGSVLVKMKAITVQDLREAIEVQEKAGKNRKPLIATLLEQGKIELDEATRALKKLVEMTVVELIGWTKGTFTFDTDVIPVTPACNYPVSDMQQEIILDAQMVLMDALRVYDERQRDSEAGRTVGPDEELYADVIPEVPSAPASAEKTITADDLGLGDLDHLERKMPVYMAPEEIFDPLEIHRQRIRQILAGFSAEEQEAFVEFLERSTAGRGDHEGRPARDRRVKALVLFSDDELIKHSVMTVCKADDVLVFAAEGEAELDSIMEQCLRIRLSPILVFDDMGAAHELLSRETIVGLRRRLRDRYREVPVIQLSPVSDYSFTLESFRDGARAVFPKPARERQATFTVDMLSLLGTFKTYIRSLLGEQDARAFAQDRMSGLRDRIVSLRNFTEPSGVRLALLQHMAESFERAITFVVLPEGLQGEKAIGVFAGKNVGPTSVTRLKVPLPTDPALRGMIDSGRAFCGKIDDEVLSGHLFGAIGEPLNPEVILLPVKGRGRTAALVYADFGDKEGSSVQCNSWEILAVEAGLALENLHCGDRPDRASAG